LKEGQGLFRNAGGEVAAARAPQIQSSSAGAKSESAAADEKGVEFTLGGLQKFELLPLLAQHLHVGIDPVLVDFDGQCSDQAQTVCSLGEILITWVRRLTS
jgi:hypothetical protein